MKICIEAYGCTLNHGEAQMMARILDAEGHEIIEERASAELFLLVTCTVIEHTERKMLKLIRSWGTRPLIVAGCMAAVQKDKIREFASHAMILEPRRLNEISTVVKRVEEKIAGCRQVVALKNEGSATLHSSLSSIDATVPIAQGCLGHCSYCITRIARGKLRSYPVMQICEQIKIALAEGKREIRLTAQDTAAYGRDLGLNLCTMINAVTKIDGEFRVRIGMMNPSSVLPILDSLVNAYRDEKVFKFLHLPIQSGSDRVLKTMKREYTVKDALRIVETFRKEFPEIMLSTDIITGFPTETEEEFMESYRLMEMLKPDIINVTRYSSRPFTAAAGLKQIPGWIAKERSRALTKLRFELSAANNKNFVGRNLRVLVTEPGKNGTFIARTDTYRPVIIKESCMPGEFIDVQITDYTPIYLIG